MKRLLSRSLERGAQQVEIHRTESLLQSVRMQGHRVSLQDGLQSRYQLRLIIDGKLGIATAQRFSDQLIHRASALALSDRNYSRFLGPQPYVDISGINDPEIRTWSMDEMRNTLDRLQSCFHPYLRTAELSIECEEIELSNSLGLHGRYTHALSRLVVLTGDSNGGPGHLANYYWRTKPALDEMADRIQSLVHFDSSNLPFTEMAGTHTVIFSPPSAILLLEDLCTRWLTNPPLNVNYPEFFTMGDDPTQASVGSRPFDDKGNPSQPNNIIVNGQVIPPPTGYAGFHYLQDNSQLAVTWNSLRLTSSSGVESMSDGFYVERMERLGGSYVARGFVYSNGERVHRFTALLRENADSLLTRLEAIGSDPVEWDTVQAPSLRVARVEFSNSILAM